MNIMNTNIFKLAFNTNKNLPKINFKFEPTEINDKIDNGYLELIDYKNKIENYKNWDIGKKYSNIYELIYLPNKKFRNNSVSNYDPLSRSYFKLLEMIVDFDLLSLRRKLKIACIAEGPGGFIESIINYRKRVGKFEDSIYAITLKSTNNDIPGWKKSKNFIKKNKINISYGSDNTGNLYKIENILHFSNNFNNDVDFITADGGFDFSYNFNKQEKLSCRILFCEITTALSIQKIGGTFVIKFFDIYNEITYSLLYLLYTTYNYIYITKPNTSRPANSEKYIICKDFKGIDKQYLNKLYIIVKNWEYVYNKNMFIKNLFIVDNDYFIKEIVEINKYFFNEQKKNIKETLKIIDDLNNNKLDLNNNKLDLNNNKLDLNNNKLDLNNNKLDLNNNKLDLLNQTITAFKWCKKYKVSINYNSNYIINYKFILTN